MNIIEFTKDIITEESLALKQMADCVNQDYEKVVELIHRSKSRVIATGIGKSAIVAQKIVATMNSTGTPAIFMHAADAIHGDLGTIQPNDVILCLSKSGNTPEIKLLIPLIRNLNQNNKIVAMVSNKDSLLAKDSDFVLYIPVDKEACPNNLAPTTSTTLQMVAGDALALSLLKLKGFTKQDFAKYHPGGSLGKQLYTRVIDLIDKTVLPKVYEDTLLKNVIIEMTLNKMGATVVLNHDEKMVGIITDGDLRRMLQHEEMVTQCKAKEIMSANPKTIQSNMLAVEAYKVMTEKKITQLIVLDDSQYVGMIHLHQILREGIL